MSELWEDWFQSAGIKAPAERGAKLQVQSSAQVVEVLQSRDSVALIDRNFMINDIDSGRLTIACEHMQQDEEGYFLTFPESAESLPSLQSFKASKLQRLAVYAVGVYEYTQSD